MDLLPPLPPGTPTDSAKKPGITIRFDSKAEIEAFKLLARVFNEMDAVRGYRRPRQWSASSVLKLAADTYLAEIKKRLKDWPEDESGQTEFLLEIRKRAEKEVARSKKK